MHLNPSPWHPAIHFPVQASCRLFTPFSVWSCRWNRRRMLWLGSSRNVRRRILMMMPMIQLSYSRDRKSTQWNSPSPTLHRWALLSWACMVSVLPCGSQAYLTDYWRLELCRRGLVIEIGEGKMASTHLYGLGGPEKSYDITSSSSSLIRPQSSPCRGPFMLYLGLSFYISCNWQ